MLKKLIVKNFKSLHNCEITFGKFNVVIGRNASGKTNLIEVFKLLRKIYIEKDPFPFLEWWGYNNVVWQRKEELPVTIGLIFDIEGYEVFFETTFTGTGGSFKLLKEILEIKDYFKIIKENELLRLGYNKDFIKTLPNNILFNNSFVDFPKIDRNILLYQKINIGRDYEDIFLKDVLFNPLFNKTSLEINEKYIIHLLESEGSEKVCYLLYPKNFSLMGVLFSINSFFSTILSFMPPHIKDIKTPKPAKKEMQLKEDGSNLTTVLYNLYLKEGKIPDEIMNPLLQIFPNTRIFFQLTDDGRVLMKVFENGIELSPQSISDGFYKMLLILTAIYLKPSLLIIDEIENSLYPEALEWIFDTLKYSNSQIVITTHSPIVVDITDPKDVIFVVKELGESNFDRIKNPERLKEKLNDLGLSFSEGWIYGNIFEEER